MAAPALDLDEPSNLATFVEAAQARLYGNFIRLRVLLGPLAWTLIGLWPGLQIDPDRLGLLRGLLTTLVAYSALEWALYRRHGLTTLTIPRNLVLMGSFQITFISLTGGLVSPLIPGIPVFGFIAGLFGPRTLSRLVVVVDSLALLAMATLHGWWSVAIDGTPPVHGALLLARGLVIAVVLGIAMTVGATIRAGSLEAFRQAEQSRRETLTALAEQSRTLTALSGEIAHELKNPLASIKGLGALLAPALTGKEAERLAVLRGEVDRMQQTLEGFLQFSRPLLPLQVERVALRSLVEEVVRLHEGLAAARGVALEVRGEAEAPCDPRKVRQVLVNLLQNALEASPSGGRVELAISTADGAVQLAVRDGGTGLPVDAAARARLFEPGVTTKPSGSGIGLTLARGLVRQHGGELLLQPASGGGTEALASWPLASPRPA